MCAFIVVVVVLVGLSVKHKMAKPGSPDVIKTMDKTISDDATGYRFAHLTTVVVDGKTGKIKLLSTQMLPLPKLPKPVITEGKEGER